MPYIFLIAFGVVLGLLLLQRLQHAETKFLVLTLKWTFVGVLTLASLYLTLVGRLFHVIAIGILLALLLHQDVHRWIKRKPLALPPPERQKKGKKSDK